MRKLRVLLFMFLIAFSISSCKEPEDIVTLIEGKLLTAGNNEVVPEGPYLIQVKPIPGNTAIDEIYTDENGYYHFEYGQRYEEIETDFFELEVKPPFPEGYSNCCKARMDIGHRIPAGFHGTVNLLVYKMAWVRIHLVNLDPKPEDRIRIQWGGHPSVVFYGVIDTELIYPGNGLVSNQLHYWVVDNGATNMYHNESVTLGDNDTTYYKIEF